MKATFYSKYLKNKNLDVLLEEAMKAESSKENFVIKKQDSDNFIYVPSIKFYVSKERTHLELDRYQTHEVLNDFYKFYKLDKK